MDIRYDFEKKLYIVTLQGEEYEFGSLSEAIDFVSNKLTEYFLEKLREEEAQRQHNDELMQQLEDELNKLREDVEESVNDFFERLKLKKDDVPKT